MKILNKFCKRLLADPKSKMVGKVLILALLAITQAETVRSDDIPILYTDTYLPAIFNVPVLPVFPPCPTPDPGKPVVC